MMENENRCRILEVRGIGKRYGNARGIRDVDLELFAGDVFGLLGPNGAGKTTLLKIMTGLIRADRGTVSLFGCPLDTHFAQAMRRVGCMIESADFYDYISALRYLRLLARYYPGVTDQRIEHVLDSVGLLQVQHDKIRQYSTGMKQKLALAAAVLAGPEFVILDEPTNGLDIEGTVMFRELVKRLAEELGTTFLISSHMIHELEQLCNRVGVIYEGTMVTHGFVSELLAGGQSLEQFYIDQLKQAREEKADAKL